MNGYTLRQNGSPLSATNGQVGLQVDDENGIEHVVVAVNIEGTQFKTIPIDGSFDIDEDDGFLLDKIDLAICEGKQWDLDPETNKAATKCFEALADTTEWIDF